MSVPQQLRAAAPLLALCGAALIWGAWFIYRTSFVIDGVRYTCLLDDAMISMTYARNLLAGYGLNWARMGEPVEGFTHPLWLALMIPINGLPVGLPYRSVAVQLVSLLALLLNIVAVRALMVRHFTTERAGLWLPAALLTAFYYPLNHWALRGMETGLQALVTVTAVYLTLNIVYAGTRQHRALGAILAAAVLLRMDMLILVAAVVVVLAAGGGLRRTRWREAAAGAAILAAAVAGYGLFRWMYFHDVLPNTYYLKMTGTPVEVRVWRGLLVFLDAMRPAAVPLLAAAGLALLNVRARPQLVLPAVVPLLYFAYSIYVGGDVWEFSSVGANRFVSFVMPLVFVVLNAGLNFSLDRARARQARRRGAHRVAATPARVWRWAGIGLGTAICWVAFNGLWRADRLGERWRNMIVADAPMQLEDHIAHVHSTRALGALLRPGALVAVVWAGVPSYFSEFRMADVLGYNDRVVAHGPAMFELSTAEAAMFQPGHMKWNYDHLLGELRPDLVLETWPVGHWFIPKLMRRYGYVQRQGYWVREGSSYLRDPEPGAASGG